jgi:hypothetical protein
METQFSVRNYYHHYGGAEVVNSDVRLFGSTGGESVGLMLAIAWGVDRRLMRSGYTGDDPIFNICHRFCVVLPNPASVWLGMRTLEYFDGAPHSVIPTYNHSVIRLHNKWRASVTGFINPPGPLMSLDPLEAFMRRRLRNAYGIA